MPFRLVLLRIAFLLLAGVSAVPALAQTEPPPATRAEALRQEREKKQQALSPNEPDGLQRTFDFIEDHALTVLSREGFYPKIGSLTTGSGFALGLGYRDRNMFARRGVAELWGAASVKKYWALQARAAFPDLAGDRVMLEAVANLREYPSEAFFGLGPDAAREDFIEYLLRTREFAATGGVRLAPALIVGGSAALFTPETELLGVLLDVDYVRTGAFVEVDYREPLQRAPWRLVSPGFQPATTIAAMATGGASSGPTSICGSSSAFSPTAA